MSAPDKHDARVLFVCENCEEFNPEESPARPRDDIAVMPDGTWLCDECYAECEKPYYGLPDPQNRDENYEHPEFEDLPRPPLVVCQPRTGDQVRPRVRGGYAAIEDDAVVIRFPLAFMQTAIDGAWGLNVFDKRQKVTDQTEFAKEFCRELNAESENGTTLIHSMADKAFVNMIESGAFGFDDYETAQPSPSVAVNDRGAS